MIFYFSVDPVANESSTSLKLCSSKSCKHSRDIVCFNSNEGSMNSRPWPSESWWFSNSFNNCNSSDTSCSVNAGWTSRRLWLNAS